VLPRALRLHIDRERETIVTYCDNLEPARLVTLLENLALLSPPRPPKARR
jgi:hypothetical protein